MAAIPQMGVDPSGQPVPMPPDQGPPQGDPSQPQVDPNAGPADPMLAHASAGDPQAEEYQTRERVELQLLLAIEACARACMAGEGASNPQFVQANAQACQALGLSYQSLATIEQKENAPPPMPPQFGQQPSPTQSSFIGQGSGQ